MFGCIQIGPYMFRCFKWNATGPIAHVNHDSLGVCTNDDQNIVVILTAGRGSFCQCFFAVVFSLFLLLFGRRDGTVFEQLLQNIRKGGRHKGKILLHILCRMRFDHLNRRTIPCFMITQIPYMLCGLTTNGRDVAMWIDNAGRMGRIIARGDGEVLRHENRGTNTIQQELIHEFIGEILVNLIVRCTMNETIKALEHEWWYGS
mmetsp:Transcript_5148/g.9626  ORF Transcript_5148/g.9626 Transcript_5148/m.9626 type:complete len:203 (+) Transcript_5148:177-785(+)